MISAQHFPRRANSAHTAVEVRPELTPDDVDWLNTHLALAGSGLSYARTTPIPQTCQAPGWRDCSKVRGGECGRCLPRTPAEAREYGLAWRDEWGVAANRG